MSEHAVTPEHVVMSEHTHTWEPDFEQGIARYECVCGKRGYRKTVNHKIVEIKHAKPLGEPQWRSYGSAPTIQYDDNHRQRGKR